MGVTLGILRYTVRAATPALALGTAALTAVLAACSDSPTAPASAPVAASRSPAARGISAGKHVSPTAHRSGVTAQHAHGDTLVSTLVLQPDSQAVTAVLGNSTTLSVPAGATSVCARGTSNYGPGTWDAPCTASTDSVVITARSWLDASGTPRVAFSPALRFVPDASGGRAVLLALKNPHAKFSGGANRIDYCPTLGDTPSGDAGAAAKGNVDEAASDPRVATVTTPNGFWQRRVKHFAGYTVLVN